MGGSRKRPAADLLARAVWMMRETNPNNLNLPYMLEDYSTRLVMPEYQAVHERYRQAARPSTAKNNF